MKLLVVGKDPLVFNKESKIFRRVLGYSRFCEEMHIVSAALPGTAPMSSGNLFLWPVADGLFWWFRARRMAVQIIKQNRIKLIDTQDPFFSGLAGFLVAKKFKLPWRVQVHTDVFSKWFRRISFGGRLQYRLAKFLIPRADCVRVVSERIKNSIRKELGHSLRGSVSVLPIFTDVSKFMRSNSGNRKGEYGFKMLAVGRFVDKEKNFSMLIKIMDDLAKSCPGSSLVIMGSGPDGEKYEKLIRIYGLEKSVIIRGWEDEMAYVYADFDLFLLSSNYEGWGRVVLEAMASGLPIVMTDVGLAGEVVRNGEEGLVVPVGDIKAFMNAIRYLCGNREKIRMLGEMAQKRVFELNPKTEDDYIESYGNNLLSCLNK